MGVRSECRAEPARWPQCITNLSADPDWLGRDVAKTLIATCAMDTGARCVFCINNRRQQPYGPSLAGALKVCKSLPGFRSAPGGQLVQESDVVRARAWRPPRVGRSGGRARQHERLMA